jgi:L-alanine-DL-glutamate epimerase-like enolase superfamily enzyme
MPKIVAARPVLLSAPYGPAEGNAEVMLHLPAGLRTTGLVEITLEDGTKGLGEGYLAVFAPDVFIAIVNLLSPILVGREVDTIAETMRALEIASGYWSFQGAARHILSAFEIAMQDARAQALGLPLWQALGGAMARPLPAYGSGGDSVDPAHMRQELELVAALGLSQFKIRARSHQADKAVWCQRAAADSTRIAVDMTQNLAVPSQTGEDIEAFLSRIAEAGVEALAFLEEIQGPLDVKALPELRRTLGVPVAGGEIVTTPAELADRIEAGWYDIAQPDATVIGGVGAVLDVFNAARRAGVAVYVHCWGAGVGMLANYHAALAAGGKMVEWPLPDYPLRAALFADPVQVIKGEINLSDRPGLGARLTPEIEAAYPFRRDATYRCLVDPTTLPQVAWR